MINAIDLTAAIIIARRCGARDSGDIALALFNHGWRCDEISKVLGDVESALGFSGAVNLDVHRKALEAASSRAERIRKQHHAAAYREANLFEQKTIELAKYVRGAA